MIPPSLVLFPRRCPPGAVDIRAADALKLSIENSKYLEVRDVEHTHLVKGLDYALLNKVRSEIDKKPDTEDDGGKASAPKEDQRVTLPYCSCKGIQFTSGLSSPQTVIKSNELFLPGRMTFVYDMEGGYTNDINALMLYRSKADCPLPEELVTVNVDGSVLDRIAKIMTYLRLGSTGKFSRRKKKEKDVKGKTSTIAHGYDEDSNQSKIENGSKNISQREVLPPPPHYPADEDDIFVGDGVNYTVPGKDVTLSPISEDMEESPRIRRKSVILLSQCMVQYSQLLSGYGEMHTQGLAAEYPGDWQDYQYAEQTGYQEPYLQPGMEGYVAQPETGVLQDPQLMSQEEKDRGERHTGERSKFCIRELFRVLPGYQEYNHEVVGSDEEADLSKMDMGGKAKGALHRWDFETEEEWEKYNEQKEAMPKAAFQFGVKMQDGRKTKKQNRDQKLNNELNKINKIITRKKMEKEGGDVGSLMAMIHLLPRDPSAEFIFSTM
ncbi:hypothetical protein Bca52824_035313 [Brassica carinata]|uniref:Uncharacterized protein n=1 Tax=Brassica carinata TaxID=52824 RepID=A0A8X7V3Y6_BRACI|nr:hypothetical protein Bca52824_035308 [Brassica carinata]KAG2298839.1 hypothetical protein Bca52824_035311 [Brassica carinata]KAG2298841.1 hypothetical protein Bca52824_035313 [Brassica carinata]